ncbi:hypothetical protein TOPH_05241 [Tolypocladium ophioglossoides CBS 100239]|uniref:ABM domain-containing protein n=1 Tax=Tolypocladium ophioglossoides (strain CBS 100239) TaxID=1163406 RepID=A0A0L0N7Z5_TOLOC|nr:hypothetical protein TOPH_05241 [Tolypocladium ophioglossoides CBS 100239]
MASQEFVQVATLGFKPSLQPDPSHPPASFADVSAQLQAVPGVKAIYLGQQMERPATWTWAVRWASAAALDAFLASPSFTGWLASFRAVTDSYIFSKALLRGDVGAALNAPCTEVFTAYGATDGFLESRMKPFAANVAAGHLPGHHGSAFGQFEVLTQDGVIAPDGNTVSMILGWDTKEAHLAQRGDGKLIDNNVHYVREDRQSVDMYHVKLTKL